MFGENIQGHSVLLCRYLREMEPHHDIVDLTNRRTDNSAIEKVARYVSLIPYINDINAF